VHWGSLTANWITTLASRHRWPAVYSARLHHRRGLISYGPDTIDPFRRAASYVDRIFKGDKPADLPGAGADEKRIGRQPQDGQGARPHDAVVRTRRADEVIE